MTGLAVRETVTLAGRAERARVAREFVGGVLGAGHPCGDVAALLVSELFGNSVRYSRSGALLEASDEVVLGLREGPRSRVCHRGQPRRQSLAAHWPARSPSPAASSATRPPYV
jgi:hypothetical protein